MKIDEINLSLDSDDLACHRKAKRHKTTGTRHEFSKLYLFFYELMRGLQNAVKTDGKGGKLKVNS